MEADKPGGPNAQGRRFASYKLIVDPALVKGALKLYRFDGAIPGDTSSPSILLRDPRKQKSLRCILDPLVLPVPAFEIDENYVGAIPPTEVTLTNLNDNVSQAFLRTLSGKFGLVEEVQIFLHPISHRHLGFGHTVFKSSRDAKTCVERLNGTLVMGQKVNVFHDPGGKKCKELFIEVTTQKPGKRTSSVVKSDDRNTSNSYNSVSTSASSSNTSLSGTSAVVKPPPPKSSSKKSHSHASEGYYGNGHHYKDENRRTPHYDGVPLPFTTPEDRKSSHSSSKGSSRSRDKDRVREDKYKRSNSVYDRSESYNYGYPMQGSSSRSTPSTSSLTSPHSSYHHHHHYNHSHHHHHHHQQNSFPPSPRFNANNKNSGDHHHTLLNSKSSTTTSDKVCEEGELSPKIDLDTRIKMMLEGRNSGEFGKLFTDGNISAGGSDSESDTEASPLKRARLSLGSASAKLWDSESDEDVSKEVSFAKKFKQSFVPVSDGSQVVSSSQHSSSHPPSQQHHNAMSSPPPSPFLTFSQNSTTKSVRGKADPEFDQISDDDDGQVGGGGAAGGDDKDDMSLSSLSPDDAAGSRIRQSRFSSAPPPPPPPGHVHGTYYGEYYNNTYSSNYQMPAWGSHHHQQNQQHYQHQHAHHQHRPEYHGNYQTGYSGSYEHHHSQHHQGSSYHPPNAQHYPEKHVEVQRPPSPPPQEDHKNPNLLIKALIEVMVEDLKKVLRRDCNRRLIETEAFKMYEEWWDRQAREFKRKQDEENAKNLPTSSVPAPAEVRLMPDDNTGGQTAVVIAARSTSAMASGFGTGLGLRNAIPKLPSFRKSIKAPEPPQDEDSRKSFLDSDSDSLASSDDEIVGRKSKPRFSFSSSDDDSDDSSSVSSKSSVREEEVHGITDAEAISTTDDEEGIAAYKTKPEGEEEDDYIPKTPTMPPRMELEDILSEDDSPEESVKTPEQDPEGTFGICATTGRLLFKPTHHPPEDELSLVTNRKLTDSSVTPNVTGVDLTSVKQEEVEEGEIDEEEAAAAAQAKLELERLTTVKSEPVSKSSMYADYLKSLKSLAEVEDDKSIIVPYDAVRPRGYKKSSKPMSFRSRLDHERLDLVYEFLKKGIDGEDIKYFQKAYENLLFDDTLNWLNCTHWVDHPETVIKKKVMKQKRPPKVDNEEGSLRTRGFVRMTQEEKSRAMAGQQPVALMSYDGALPSEKLAAADMGKVRETQIREARSNQRRLLTVLGTESDLLKFNQLHFRKKALRFARSGIHDWGLFAAEPIAADEMVIEYVGQMIRPVIADLRELNYEKQGIGSSYLFKIDPETIIDATRCGNLSRFINHSCNPNCYAKVITVEGKKKMVIYSKQPIAVSEEITYDYKFPIEDKKIPCLCGTPQCRGTLN